MQEPKRACPFWCSQSAVRCSLIADRCYQSIFQLYSLFAILSIFIHNSPTSKGLLRTVFCTAARDCKPAADSLPAKARPPPQTSPAGRLEAPRKGIGKARCRTPQSAGADITGLRCPHRAACAEAHLRSATAAPAPSRCIRRRRRSTPQPLTGEPFKRQSPQSLPCKGRWMRRKAQTKGCIAALRRKYPVKSGRTLPCASQVGGGQGRTAPRKAPCRHIPRQPFTKKANTRRPAALWGAAGRRVRSYCRGLCVRGACRGRAGRFGAAPSRPGGRCSTRQTAGCSKCQRA